MYALIPASVLLSYISVYVLDFRTLFIESEGLIDGVLLVIWILFSPGIPYNFSIWSSLYPLAINTVDIEDVYSDMINSSLSPNSVIWVL